jgi:chemotaxis protein MotB
MSKRKEAAEHEASSERWLLTYSDMITLLMVFFIVMYSMANTDLKKFAQVAVSMQQGFSGMGMGIGGKGASAMIGGKNGGGNSPAAAFFKSLPPMQRDFVSISSQLSAFAEQAGLKGQISVNMNMEGIIISLSNTLVFESGGTELRPESIQSLHEIANILRETTNLIRIEGHTDNLPTNNPLYPTNWELSVARAVTIVRFLIDEEGLKPERLSAAGYGEYRPMVPNSTRANRALNRRADIVIIYPNASKKFDIGLTTAGKGTEPEKNSQTPAPPPPPEGAK